MSLGVVDGKWWRASEVRLNRREPGSVGHRVRIVIYVLFTIRREAKYFFVSAFRNKSCG